MAQFGKMMSNQRGVPTDLKGLVRELQAAEDDAGARGHTAERHDRIVAATEAVRVAADAAHRDYLAHGHGYLYTITAENIRDPRGTLGTRYFALTMCMGSLMPRDCGKRVYNRNGVLQVENDEQLAARMKASPKIRYRDVFIERQLQGDGGHLFICHTGISKFLPDLYETQDQAIKAVDAKLDGGRNDG